MKQWINRLVNLEFSYVDMNHPEANSRGRVSASILGILREIEYLNDDEESGNIVGITMDKLLDNRTRTRQQYRHMTNDEFEKIPTETVHIKHNFQIYISKEELMR